MKVVLTLCPPWGIISPPLSLGYLEEALVRAGVDVHIYDLNIRLHNRVDRSLRHLWDIGNHPAWKNPEALFRTYPELRSAAVHCLREMTIIVPEIMGMSVVDPNQTMSCWVAEEFQQICPETTIVLGGPACHTDTARRYFDPCSVIRGFVVGEGERAFPALIEHLRSGTSPERVPGVLWRGASDKVEPAPQVDDLDQLHFPRYQGFAMDEYVGQALAVLWSRGCVGRCRYCKERTLWAGLRARSPCHRIEEIEYHLDAHGFREFVVYDSAVNGDIEGLECFCDLVADRKLEFGWSAEAIPTRLDRALLGTMRRAGCHTLVFGVESGDPDVLRAMRKGFDLSRAEQVLEEAHGVGIRCWLNFIVGYPGEDRRSFERTLEFIRRNRSHIDAVDSISRLQLVEGTALTEGAESQGILRPAERDHDRWYTTDGNTPDLRIERLQELSSLLDELSLPVGRNILNEAS